MMIASIDVDLVKLLIGLCVCVCVCVRAHVLSRSVVFNAETPWTVARQAPLSMGILQARKLEWVAMPVNWNIFKTSSLLE